MTAAKLTIRNSPEDFVVVEEPLYAPSGDGKHTFLLVEKRGRTTEQVARELARVAEVTSRDVGYAGRKDRHAVTRQWFSVPGLAPEQGKAFSLTGAEVLESVRHEHKLKTGHLRGNRFEIVVRADSVVDLERAQAKAEELVRRGMPNRYGDQRFGRDGDNADKARRLLAGELRSPDRREARFLVSALQSEIFNAVLKERAEKHDEVMLGDLARVEESGGLFWVDDLAREQPRATAFEISATGPIFGTKVRAPVAEAAELETRVFETYGIPQPGELRLPRGIRARGTRRPLRVRPEALRIEALAPGEGEGVRVCCGLPSGAYVTVLLECLLGEVVDMSRGDRGGGDASDSRSEASPDGSSS